MVFNSIYSTSILQLSACLCFLPFSCIGRWAQAFGGRISCERPGCCARQVSIYPSMLCVLCPGSKCSCLCCSPKFACPASLCIGKMTLTSIFSFSIICSACACAFRRWGRDGRDEFVNVIPETIRDCLSGEGQQAASVLA